MPQGYYALAVTPTDLVPAQWRGRQRFSEQLSMGHTMLFGAMAHGITAIASCLRSAKNATRLSLSVLTGVTHAVAA